jgi:hypothetical protein
MAPSPFKYGNCIASCLVRQQPYLTTLYQDAQDGGSAEIRQKVATKVATNSSAENKTGGPLMEPPANKHVMMVGTTGIEPVAENWPLNGRQHNANLSFPAGPAG